MVKWRLLPFIRLGGKKNNQTTADGSADDVAANVHTYHNNTTNTMIDQDQSVTIHQRRRQLLIEESMWGCSDEISNCPNLDGLFELDGITCRWPSAELCLSTCYQCPLVDSAKSCQSLEGEINDRLLHEETIDWSSFFEDITSMNTTQYPYLKDAKIRYL